MSNGDEDLDLLLSLEDRVLETPAGSPSIHSPGYLSGEGSPRQIGQANMSVFRNAVQDCLDFEPEPVLKTLKSNRTKASNDPEVERFSGLRIRNQLVTSTDLGERFSDIRFVRLPTIKNLMVGDTLSGCWATVGVLTEKGTRRTSSNANSYSIWKIGCLDEDTISVFLFGDAYKNYCNEHLGTILALFNSTVRKDAKGSGFSLSVYSPSQILKMGISSDYGVCKGKRKDGMDCTVVINKWRGYCKYHKSTESQKFSTMRTELKGGNIRSAFWNHHKAEGIYLVDPLADKTNISRAKQPVKILSVEGLKKALSNAGKVTTNAHSQGIRFLSEVTVETSQKIISMQTVIRDQHITSFEKRKSSDANVGSSGLIRNEQRNTKRYKTGNEQTFAKKPEQATGKMIELDYVSSDEEI